MEDSPVGVTDPATDWFFSSLSVIVDVEGDRENVLASGPKWVSFSSGRGSLCQRRWSGADRLPTAQANV